MQKFTTWLKEYGYLSGNVWLLSTSYQSIMKTRPTIRLISTFFIYKKEQYKIKYHLLGPQPSSLINRAHFLQVFIFRYYLFTPSRKTNNKSLFVLTCVCYSLLSKLLIDVQIVKSRIEIRNKNQK